MIAPEDNVMAENTSLHPAGAPGTGFESATPRHPVSSIPNSLAAPYRAADPSNVRATSREPGQVGATPLRTPMRDSFSINPDDEFPSAVQTPHENRMRESASKRAWWAGFMNLPKPKNNFELMVPEDEEDEKTQRPMKEEDAVNVEDKKLRVPSILLGFIYVYCDALYMRSHDYRAAYIFDDNIASLWSLWARSYQSCGE